MIGHQHVRMHDASMQWREFVQQPEVEIAMADVWKHRASIIATLDDVQRDSGQVVAGSTGQVFLQVGNGV